MIARAYDIFEDESEDVYCEIKPCKRQRVKRWFFVCLGCTIKYEAKNKAKFNSCCGGDDVNFTFTNKVKFHKHLDEHRKRGEYVPDRYYEMELV